MTTLPPFSGDDPTCPKCGNVGATVKFMALGDCVHESRLTLGLHRNERLHRECRRCDYAWDEATVEQPKEAT